MTVKELKEILNNYDDNYYVGIGKEVFCEDSIGIALQYVDIDDVCANDDNSVVLLPVPNIA